MIKFVFINTKYLATPYDYILAFESRITNIETYSKLCQASKMGFLVKIVNGLKQQQNATP